jgi:hypothetical protein
VIPPPDGTPRSGQAWGRFQTTPRWCGGIPAATGCGRIKCNLLKHLAPMRCPKSVKRLKSLMAVQIRRDASNEPRLAHIVVALLYVRLLHPKALSAWIVIIAYQCLVDARAPSEAIAADLMRSNKQCPTRLIHEGRLRWKTGIFEQLWITTGPPPMRTTSRRRIGIAAWMEAVAALRETTMPQGWTRSDDRNYALVISPDGTMAINVATGDLGTGRPNSNPSNNVPKGVSTADAISVNQTQLELPLPVSELPPVSGDWGAAHLVPSPAPSEG